MQNWRWRLGCVAAVLWLGSLIALLLLAGALFADLPSRALAGNVVARLFSAQTWISAGCAIALLLLARPGKTGDAATPMRAGLLLPVILGLLLALLTEYVAVPGIADPGNMALWRKATSMSLAEAACALAALRSWLEPAARDGADA